LRAEAAAVLAGLIAADEALPPALDRDALVRELVDEPSVWGRSSRCWPIRA
jgi:hypothetical protein